MAKRILFISNLYPNPLFPNMATFNRQQVQALSEYCNVEVLSPIPWTVFLKKNLKQRVRLDKAVTVHHPTYYYTPYIMRSLYGKFFYYSIKNVALSLLEQNKFDLIYSSWLYPDSYAAAILAERYGLPLFVKVHGSDVNRLVPGTAISNSSLEVANHAEKLVCVSKALKDRLIDLGVPDSKLEVHYNGVDSSLFYPMDRQVIRRQLKIDPDEFLVLYVGNLKKEKGLYELIASFKSASDAVNKKMRLVIIGSGGYAVTAEKMIVSLHLFGKVQLLGSQSLGTIARWMNAASLLCLPSYMEGIPNVILEAFACGTNVIATAVGGIPELDSGNGRLVLVPPQDIDSLVTAFRSSVQGQQVSTAAPLMSSWKENAENLMQTFFDEIIGK